MNSSTTQSTITLPKYIVLEEMHNIDSFECSHCGRPLKHPNLIKDTTTNEKFYLGSTCTENYLGKSIKEIKDETEEFEEAEKAERSRIASEYEAREYVKSFKEANEDMMTYINENTSNSFISSMKKRIEETGTLTKNMHSVIYSMMLPVANLDAKIKDVDFRVIRVKKQMNDFGENYTIFGETSEGLIRVYFSNITKVKELLVDKKILDSECFIYENINDRDIHLKVSGSFDGYKIKRAKLAA